MFTRHAAEFTPVNTTAAFSGAMVNLGETTMLETETGWKQVAELSPGDAVATLDGGFAPIAWIGQSLPVQDAYLIHEGALGNCSTLVLPGQTLIGREAPRELDATSDHISLPLSALEGSGGIVACPGKTCMTRTLGFENEEMLWAQTGMLIHAHPMGTTFFQTLSFAEARTMLRLEASNQFVNAVAA